MRHIDYSDFCESLASNKPPLHKPLNGQWAITNDCNLKCLHCYVAKDKNYQELNFKQITDIIDQFYQEGCLWLTFTGGEPFMRKDFLDIYTYAKNKGFLITIFTNGTLLTSDIVNYLKEYPPFMIEITLHSIRPNTFDAVTRVRDSFRKCMEGVRLIMDKGLPLTLKTVGLTLNKNDIFETKKFIKKLPGVQFKFDSLVIPRHDGSRSPLKLRLSPQEIVDIETNDEEMFQQWRDCIDGDGNIDTFGGPWRCDAGLSSFHINPYGVLQLCSEMTRPAFDLKQGSFQDGFYNFLFQLRSLYSLHHICSACKVRHLCCQCPAIFLLENGDSYGPAEYLCQVAHLRQEHLQSQGTLT